ncbi:hypothetical protein [Neorhizobium petrolearium]|uniref:Transposase n=1 Tax=Neorhizobium petrolearium TaxID=515361 RepID=A0ABY8M265_9HYPH|nr:hypothetical protein [Neorhizobium petrolearium]MCC2608359.1 hypothetical protein [Neorhizobium petrolearium]WGI68638.1 hypothetical protein QEO92_00625 [Neorhizobium petrolearium]
MGKQTYRVEKKLKEFEFDEEAVREAYLAGEPPNAIALRYGGNNAHAVANFISYRKQQWLNEARYSRLQADEIRIVLPRRVADRSGGSYVMPISLPRISMHIAALQETRHV